jgi:hypothetical protein
MLTLEEDARLGWLGRRSYRAVEWYLVAMTAALGRR